MFGRLTRHTAWASVAALATLALSQSSVSADASKAPPPQPRHAGHHLAMRTAHVRLSDGSNHLGPEPCSDYFGQRRAHDVPDAFGGRNPLAVCGYTPEQLRNAYGVSDSGLSGAGVTVAIVDAYASPTMLSDANRYAANHGERPLAASQYREITPSAYNHVSDGVCENPAAWNLEEALDVEAVHAMAPQADIVYVAAASCDDTDLMAALQKVVDGRLGAIVSDSWGGIPHSVFGDEDPSMTAAYSALFQRGAREGISFLFASGDCGANDPNVGCGFGSSRPQTEYPAQDPWVTAVGGTSLGIGDSDQYLGELGWGDRRSVLSGEGWAPSAGGGEWRFGGGGGTSEDVPQPGYQAGRVPASLSDTLLTGVRTARPRRVVPDVAMDGDPMTGFLIGLTEQQPDGGYRYGESSIGGTSLATPLFAGLTADAEEGAGHPFGFLNPQLYAMAGSDAFHDVTSDSLDASAPHPGQPLANVVDLGFDANEVHQARLYQLGDDGLLSAASGYDDVTGLGSPSWSYLRSWH